MNTTTLNMTTLDGGVIIKKGTAPAPPSGGESGGGNEWHYYDMRNNTMSDNEWWTIMIMIPTLVAVAIDLDSVTEQISGAGMISNYGFNEGKKHVKYIAIDMDVKRYDGFTGGQVKSYKEALPQMGISIADILASYGITPITKEQFYNLD